MFVFGTLLVTFWSLFLMLLSLVFVTFWETPFARRLLRQGENVCFRCIFSLCLSLFSDHPVCRATFYLQIETIRGIHSARNSLNKSLRFATSCTEESLKDRGVEWKLAVF